MTITALPTAPQRTDPPDTFASRADSWVAALDTWTTQANALAVEANEDAATATTQAGIATTQAGLATTNGAAQVALAADQVALATTQANLATTNGAAQVALATTQANNAAASAVQSASSATTALNAPGTSATSATSVFIGTGSKTFTIQTGKLFVAGMTLKADSNGNWMIGSVNSYNSGTGELVLNVTNVFGSGTLNSWTISISAPMPDVPGGYSVFSFNNFI